MDQAVDSPLMAFPSEYSRAAMAWMGVAVRDLAKDLHPVLGAVQATDVDELPGYPDDESSKNTELISPLYRGFKASHEWHVESETILSFDRDTYLTGLFVLADSYGEQVASNLVNFLSETAEAAGQVVSSGNRDIYDSLIEAFEKVEFTFDERGQHNLSIIVSPELALKMKSRPPTHAQLARIDSIVQSRKRDWDASRSRRDLH